MKYITKPELALHSKLTIAAAVRKALASANSATTSDQAKTMLLKIYNKLDSYREVGVPEAISHMLGYPDHYTDVPFINIHTTHLLNYIKQLATRQSQEDHFEGEILIGNDSHLSLGSFFDDYAYRGPTYSDYCLYDYTRLVYKRKGVSATPFDPKHPQHLSHRQFLRETSNVIPTLLGHLLFLNKESDKKTEREDYYCLIVSLFFSWMTSNEIKPANME